MVVVAEIKLQDLKGQEDESKHFSNLFRSWKFTDNGLSKNKEEEKEVITVTTNLNAVVDRLITNVNKIASPQGIDKMLRSMAISTAGDMAHRIHTEGKKADGSQIGTYSEGYMKVRTGKYTTNTRFSKGKNKGGISPSGVFTKGKNKGSARPKYNRTDDTKKVYSLTRQMENDFSLKETSEPIRTATGYGVGFKNPINAQKAEWQKEYNEVYKISPQELQKVRDIADDFVANAFETR